MPIINSYSHQNWELAYRGLLDIVQDNLRYEPEPDPAEKFKNRKFERCPNAEIEGNKVWRLCAGKYFLQIVYFYDSPGYSWVVFNDNQLLDAGCEFTFFDASNKSKNFLIDYVNARNKPAIQ